MPYIIADEKFTTKEEIKNRCRSILAATADGVDIAIEHLPFLIRLFEFHDEWQEKAVGGIIGVTVKTTPHGTRCFVLRKSDGPPIDISFKHATLSVPSARTANLVPQSLRDFRNAARSAVSSQIYAFRDSVLQTSAQCPISGIPLHRNNCAVDHRPPSTFDSMLFTFCKERRINPLLVPVGSLEGTVPRIDDSVVLIAWQEYHQAKAELRLISRVANLQLPKAALPWAELWC